MVLNNLCRRLWFHVIVMIRDRVFYLLTRGSAPHSCANKNHFDPSSSQHVWLLVVLFSQSVRLLIIWSAFKAKGKNTAAVPRWGWTWAAHCAVNILCRLLPGNNLKWIWWIEDMFTVMCKVRLRWKICKTVCQSDGPETQTESEVVKI